MRNGKAATAAGLSAPGTAGAALVDARPWSAAGAGGGDVLAGTTGAAAAGERVDVIGVIAGVAVEGLAVEGAAWTGAGRGRDDGETGAGAGRAAAGGAPFNSRVSSSAL
jgi:hypothetical protein